MAERSKWGTRQMECPEKRGKAELFVEWRVEKGKKFLHSVSCDNLQLRDYSGMNCGWLCLEKISRKKK